MALLAAYNFDEATGAVVDASGNGRGFTLTASTVRTAAGHTSQGLTQDAAVIQLGPSLTGMQTANRTVMAWVKETSAATGWVLEFRVNSITSGSWGILFLSGLWQIQARNAAGVVQASIARPVDSAWHHVAGTYDGSNVRLYLDGVLVATTALAGPLRTDADEFRFIDTTSSKVAIDDARHYDTALDVATIAALMATPVDNLATLDIQSAAQDQTAQTIAFTVTDLVVQSADHAVVSGNLAPTQVHVVALADASHSQTADIVNLSTAGGLGLQAASSLQTADQVTVTQDHILAVQDGSLAQTVNAFALVVDLPVQSASQTQTADTVAIFQDHIVAIDNAAHAQTSDLVVLFFGSVTDITVTIGATRAAPAAGLTRAGIAAGPTRRDRGA